MVSIDVVATVCWSFLGILILVMLPLFVKAYRRKWRDLDRDLDDDEKE